ELVKEENDEELYSELEEELTTLANDIDQFEVQMMLNEPYDANNALLELHPGAGGTESQDWASILLRMYQRWAERKGFTIETLDYLPGDEAGVKSVTLLIKGHNAYGLLKAEKGIHRLVRISPFDSSGRRHTSLYPVMYFQRYPMMLISRLSPRMYELIRIGRVVQVDSMLTKPIQQCA